MQQGPMMSTILLAVVGLCYAHGVRAAWRQAGAGRGIRLRQVMCFAGGLAVVGVALSPPLDAMADDLFAAHMTEHVLLAAVAPPFLLFGAPLAAFAWALPGGRRRSVVAFVKRRTLLRRCWLWITAPAVGWLLHLVAMWMWHAPSLYELALRSEAVHAAEHVSFAGTAVLLWWPIAYPRTARRTAYAVGMGALFLTAMQTGVLGALITLSHQVLYPSQTAGAARWGLTPMEDQTLAGLIMWVPGGLIYVAAMSVLFVKWLEPRRPIRAPRPAHTVHLLRAQHGAPIVLAVAGILVLSSGCRSTDASPVPGGSIARGRQAVEAMGCGACHTIGGIPNAHGEVCPPLTGVARRSIIAGELANTPENMMRWIEDPQAVEPNTAMPNLGVTQQSARDIAAYLYTLR
jgi:putative membrane protein